jgi:hypothetical protein
MSDKSPPKPSLHPQANQHQREVLYQFVLTMLSNMVREFVCHPLRING